MAWIELSTYTTDEAIDWIRTLLAEINYSGEMQIESYTDSTTHLLDQSSEWTLVVRLYLPDEVQSHTQLNLLTQQLSSLQRTGMISDWQLIRMADLPSSDGLSPRHTIGQFVILSPNSTKPLTDGQIPLKVGQSLAFGSGFHPATMLCLKLLERYITPGMKTLDLGCGSGVLSVAMAKLGATVMAIDNDAIAIDATQNAVQQNGVTQLVTTFVGSLGNGSNLGHWMGGELAQNITTIQPASEFDLIVANIFARIHLSLVHDYHKALKQNGDRNGILITAGYDADYEHEIDTTFQQAGFQTLACERLGNWIAFAHQGTQNTPA